MRSAAVCCLIFAGLVVASPARPAVAADPVLKAELVAFPGWLGPNNDLQATFKVTNNGSTPLSGLQVSVEGYDGPDSRSGLADSFAGRRSAPKWGDTTVSTEGPLHPGESRMVTFDHKAPLSSISFFQTRPPDNADRAYPLRFSIGAGGYTAAPIDTQLVYFTEAQGVDHPLGLSLVIPLDTPTVFDAKDREVSRSLEAAIGPGGRISRILGALEDSRLADVAVTLAPTGKLLDSLALMASPGGFQRSNGSGSQLVEPSDPVAQSAGTTIQRLRTLAARSSVRLIAAPYAEAPLPGLTTAGGLDRDVEAQVDAGRTRLKEVLKFDPVPGWLLPTDGLLDDPTLGLVVGRGVTNVVLSPSSLKQVTPPNLTPGAQVRLKGKSASARAVLEDGVLGSRLQPDAGLSAVQIRQRFFAEAATIFLELPAKPRSVAVVAPSDWDPEAVVISGVLDALSPSGGSPWMRGVTPDDAMAQVADPPVRTIVQSVAEGGPQVPGKDYFEALRLARERLNDFTDLRPGPKGQDMAETFKRHLLVAESGEWWGRGSSLDRGKAFARSVSDGVQAEFAKIRARDQTITRTSRQAVIPLTIESRADYDVQVLVRLESDKLKFQGGQSCPAASQIQATCLSKTLQHGSQTIQVHATLNFSGRLPVRVELQTAPGVSISRARLFIRSTAYNLAAVAMTGGAALFILLSWARSFARRRVAA